MSANITFDCFIKSAGHEPGNLRVSDVRRLYQRVEQIAQGEFTGRREGFL
jgi:hypothetical protein